MAKMKSHDILQQWGVVHHIDTVPLALVLCIWMHGVFVMVPVVFVTDGSGRG